MWETPQEGWCVFLFVFSVFVYFWFAVIFCCYFLCLVTLPAVYHRLLLTGAGGEGWGGGGWLRMVVMACDWTPCAECLATAAARRLITSGSSSVSRTSRRSRDSRSTVSTYTVVPGTPEFSFSVSDSNLLTMNCSESEKKKRLLRIRSASKHGRASEVWGVIASKHLWRRFFPPVVQSAWWIFRTKWGWSNCM